MSNNVVTDENIQDWNIAVHGTTACSQQIFSSLFIHHNTTEISYIGDEKTRTERI